MPRAAAHPGALDRSALLRRVAARAASDPDAVLPVLRVLVGDDEPADVDESVLAAAEIVNSRRLAKATRSLVSRALTSEQVSERLGGASRQAIAARRARGGLLGLTVGTTSYHPDWQFGPDGVLPGLPRVLEALREVRASVLSADALMRTPTPDDRRSLAELLAEGRVDEVVARILDTGGGL
jgi:hypothetical protein